MKFERFEPTTGGALSESQREIFKLLALSEEASTDEITGAYARMANLYEDKASPAYMRIKEAYTALQKVREDLPQPEVIEQNPDIGTVSAERDVDIRPDVRIEALAVLGLSETATPDEIIDAYTSQFALYRDQIKGDQLPPALIRIKDAYTILKGASAEASGNKQAAA
jgi:hypothetical protein